jgi:hypothetical protein
VTCSASIPGAASSSTPYINSSGNGFAATAIICPVGVGALDLTRITWSPFEGHFFRSENITTYSIAISVRYQQQAPKFLGIANQSQHEIILAAPVRLNRTADETIFGTYGCSSGIVGYAPTCSGTLYFTGTPAGN